MIKRVIIVGLLVFGVTAVFFMCNKAPLPEVLSAEHKKAGHEVIDNDVDDARHPLVATSKREPKEPNEASARDLKVSQGLQRFIDKTAAITKESVANEQKKIAEGLRLALQKPTPLPRTAQVQDDGGERWDVLDFGDGIVRYVPSVED